VNQGGVFGPPRITADAFGNFLVTWERTETELVARRFDPGGTPDGPEVLFDQITDNPFIGAEHGDPAPAFAANGHVLVAWHEMPEDGNSAHDAVYARRYDADWQPQAPPVLLTKDIEANVVGGREPFTATDASGNTMVVWEVWRDNDNSTPPGVNWTFDVYAHYFDANAGVNADGLLMVDAPDATKRKFNFKSGDVTILTAPSSPLPGPRAVMANPVVDGATLQIYNTNGTGESVCVPLPSAGGSWVAIQGKKGVLYKYKDNLGLHGPCKQVTFGPGQLKLKCGAKFQPLAYSLDEPQQGSVAVLFITGETRYCAQAAGGAVVLDRPVVGTKTGQFKGRKGKGPAKCPAPPVTCP
jgi:hypothetical protein